MKTIISNLKINHFLKISGCHLKRDSLSMSSVCLIYGHKAKTYSVYKRSEEETKYTTMRNYRFIRTGIREKKQNKNFKIAKRLLNGIHPSISINSYFQFNGFNSPIKRHRVTEEISENNQSCIA